MMMRFIKIAALPATVLLLMAGFTFKRATEYLSVKIGNQNWMSKNMEVSTFKNGEKIPYVKTTKEWYAAAEKGHPAWCFYLNNPTFGLKYGKLYNWYAVNDPRGIAPAGWHIPTKSEWAVLISYLGGENIAGNKIKSTSGWSNWQEDMVCNNCKNWNAEYRSKVPCHTCKDTRVYGKRNVSGNGNNSSGFNGLAGGSCDHYGNFMVIGYTGEWWTSTVANNGTACSVELENSVGKVRQSCLMSKGMGYSVRCIKD